MLHGRVVVGREHEAHANCPNALGHLLRRQMNVGTEALEHICTAGARAHGPAAMLGHLGTCSCGHKHGRGGNVEAVGTIATSAAEVHQIGNVCQVHGHGRGELAHHLCSRGNLIHRLALDPQGHEQSCELLCRHLARHHQPHDAQHLVSREVLAGDDLCEGLGNAQWSAGGAGACHAPNSTEAAAPPSPRAPSCGLPPHPPRAQSRRRNPPDAARGWPSRCLGP